MDLVTPFLIGIGLAMDCFAVSLAIGAGKPANRAAAALVAGLFFGGFQAGMTLLGWGAGEALLILLEQVGPVVAAALLLFIGMRMIREGLEEGSPAESTDPLSLAPLTVLALATSIDALAIGFGIAAVNLPVLSSSLIIGGISLLFSVAGVLLGVQLAAILGKRVEILGGIVLIGIGIRILLEAFQP
ncbi:MAG: manganese efflux pump [Methanomicrobiales archaeon]|nr:manganese efflux pump [Methanomicrobiales archaeon]